MNPFPDFTTVAFHAVPGSVTAAQWRARFESETGKSFDECVHQTLEGIDVRPLYSAADLEGCEHLDTMPGLPPYVRGPYGSMYITKPWTVRLEARAVIDTEMIDEICLENEKSLQHMKDLP